MKKFLSIILTLAFVLSISLGTLAFGAAKKKDGTFSVTAPTFDSHGWKATATVTFKGGKVVKVDFDYLDKNGKRKTQDAAYNSAMKKASKNGMDDTTAIKKLNAQYVKSGKVDVVTGATGTYNDFKVYVQKAVSLNK